MSRLIYYEAIKTWLSRIFIVPLCLLMGLNIVILFVSMYSAKNVNSQSYRLINKTLKTLTMEEKGTFLKEKNEEITALYLIDNIFKSEALEGGKLQDARNIYKDEFDKYYEKYLSGNYLKYCDSISGEYHFIQQLNTEYQTVSSYYDFLSNTIDQADHLTDISIFKKAINDYNALNAKLTAETYASLIDIEINFFPQRGLITTLNYTVTDVIFVFAIIFLCGSIGRDDKDNGLMSIMHCTKAGRLKSAFAKVLVMCLSLFVLVILFYGTNFLFSLLQYGLGDFNSPIQSFASMIRCPFKLSTGLYILLFIFLKWYAAIILGLWVLCAVFLINNIVFAYSLAIGVPFVCYVLHKIIPSTSRWYFLKYTNVVSMFYTNEMIGNYINLNINQNPVSILKLELISESIFGVLFLSVFLILFSNFQFTKRKKFLFIRPRSKSVYLGSLYKFEFYKCFITKRLFIIFLVFASICAYIGVTHENSLDTIEIYNKKYLKAIEGKWSVEQFDWLQDEKTKFIPLYKLKGAYESNQITAKEYETLMEPLQGLNIEYRVFKNVIEYVNYVRSKPYSYLIYDTGLKKILGIENEEILELLLCCFMCIVSAANVISYEKLTGMDKILAVTPLGRKKTVLAKLKLCTFNCFLILFITTFFNFFMFIKDYGSIPWTAPIYAISNFSEYPGIPVFLILFLQFMLRFSALLWISVIVMLISYKTGSHLGTIGISLMIFCLPLLLKTTKAENLIWAGPYPIYNSISLMVQGSKYILLIILYVLLFFISIWLCSDYLIHNFGHEENIVVR